jgi:GNAT superfamily N-acetyltransferase
VRIEVVPGSSTRALRRAVLRPGWPEDAAMHGDDNPDAVHIGAFDDDGSLVGTCLVLPRPFPRQPDLPGAWQLRGMATAPERRSTGIGARVLSAAEREVARRGGHLVWCEARTTAVAFYRQHDYAIDGPEFSHAETGIPHFLMRHAIDPDGNPAAGPPRQ